MSIVRKAGTTDVSVVIRIIDSTDGTPETGVTSATSGLALEYRREGAASTAITEADLTNLNDAHSDGGMKHIGNGYYRLDLPDAACASGATGTLVHGTATGMVVIGEYVQLVAYDPFDTVRLGLTAMPNAAADAAGGLPVSDAGGLDLDTQLGKLVGTLASGTHNPQTGDSYAIVNSGTHGNAALQSTSAAIQAKTDLIPGTQDGLTFAQAHLLMACVLLGKASGLDTTTAIYRALNDSKDRITATVDEHGNRTAVTRDAT